MLLKPITNDRGTDIETLKELHLSIKRAGKLVAFGKMHIHEWHKSGHDIKKFCFFDLADEEYRIDLHERAVEKLKARFNLVLENLKY